MKRIILSIILLFNTGIASAGDWVLRPDGSGGMHIQQEGGGQASAPDTLSWQQTTAGDVSLQIIPAGAGRCEGGELTAAPLKNVRIAFKASLYGVSQRRQDIACGETVLVPAQSVAQRINIQAIPGHERSGVAKLRAAFSTPRVLLGYANFIGAEGSVNSNAIYLDLTTVQASSVVVQASFSPAAIYFGQIVAQKDFQQNTTLTIRKTIDADSAALPYELQFESSQAKNNSFQLKPSNGGESVPYQITVNNQSMLPGSIYSGVIPSGAGTADAVNVLFSLPGKSINGLKAGVRLKDTLTAVITPKS
ncbi:hypothetical protein ED28_03065 [[Pantoea] beijingensis]|uniref:Fimbrial protein n=1 Tax=[Pantoea] beijingensis TaxID=1324864 RepID=A0A443IGW6_9GAMM|nr:MULTISPECIES: hypothetical protein [Erwiniaceae]RWR03291.1 hypothetical protein ED28_03065 [[Pantoea] beijingensis]